MDHAELIAEMAYIEKLSTQERLKLARRRRLQQLKKCSQKDKEFFSSKKEKTAHNEAQKRQKKTDSKVCFASNVMILEAAARNDIEEVKALLEMNVNPDSTNEDGLTALHQCCIDDSEEMMRLLVHYGADVNAQDSEKWTPLHAAATCGHLHLAKFLISKGGNLLAVNADGNMPYDICEDDATLDYIESEMAARGVTQQLIDDTRAAVERKMLDELKRLKAEGQSLMYRDEQGATPLHVAAANGYNHVVEYLLSQNIPVEVQDNDDWSPLHAAACWGHPDVLEMLVQHGANLQAKTKNQETPYDICEDSELRERIIQLVNELETRRMNDQNRRIRRVRSNKRTQSIRRTSVREKTLTPKKEAQEEARLRIHLENKFENAHLPDVCMMPNDNLEAQSINGSEKEDELKDSNENTRSLTLLKDRIEENNGLDTLNIDNKFREILSDSGERITVFDAKDTTNDNDIEAPVCPVPPPRGSPPSEKNTVETSAPPASGENEPPVPPPRSSSASVGVGANGRDGASKIDIHVTVTLNPFAPGTLADLKKQRALTRGAQNSFTLSSGSSVFSLNTSQDLDGNASTSSVIDAQPINSSNLAVYPPQPQPSPSATPRRFCGEPGDPIGKRDRLLCCTLM